MKKRNRTRIFLMIISLVFIHCFQPDLAMAQSSTTEITFVKLTDKIAYIIDSSENEQCKCVTYYNKNEFNYAALIQMPDSSVFLRIMLVDSLGIRDIKMRKVDVEKLHLSASTNNKIISVIDTKKEEELLKILSGDTICFKKTDYKLLKFPSLLKQKVNPESSEQNTFGFINLGLGEGRFHSKSYFSFGLDLGFIYKRNIFSLRTYNIKESIRFFRSLPDSKDPIEYISDYGLLYGRIADMDGILISASVGIAYTNGIIRGAYTNSTSTSFGLFSVITNHYYNLRFQTIGMPMQVEVLFGTRHDINISLTVYGNFNQKYSFGGFLIALRLGAASTKK